MKLKARKFRGYAPERAVAGEGAMWKKVGVKKGHGPRSAENALEGELVDPTLPKFQGGSEAVPSELPTPPEAASTRGGRMIEELLRQAREGVGLGPEAVAEIKKNPLGAKALAAYAQAGIMLMPEFGGERVVPRKPGKASEEFSHQEFLAQDAAHQKFLEDSRKAQAEKTRRDRGLPPEGFKRGKAKVGVAKGFGPTHAENALEGRSTDTVPAMLTPREAVLNRNAAEMAGRGNIEALNEKGNLLAEKGVDLAGGETNMKKKAQKLQSGSPYVAGYQAQTQPAKLKNPGGYGMPGGKPQQWGGGVPPPDPSAGGGYPPWGGGRVKPRTAGDYPPTPGGGLPSWQPSGGPLGLGGVTPTSAWRKWGDGGPPGGGPIQLGRPDIQPGPYGGGDIGGGGWNPAGAGGGITYSADDYNSQGTGRLQRGGGGMPDPGWTARGRPAPAGGWPAGVGVGGGPGLKPIGGTPYGGGDTGGGPMPFGDGVPHGSVGGGPGGGLNQAQQNYLRIYGKLPPALSGRPIGMQGGAAEVPETIGGGGGGNIGFQPIQLTAPQLQMAAQKAGLSAGQIQGLMSAVQGVGSAYSSIGGAGSAADMATAPTAGYQGGISDIGYPPFVAPSADYHADKGGWLGPYDPMYKFNSY